MTQKELPQGMLGAAMAGTKAISQAQLPFWIIQQENENHALFIKDCIDTGQAIVPVLFIRNMDNTRGSIVLNISDIETAVEQARGEIDKYLVKHLTTMPVMITLVEDGSIILQKMRGNVPEKELEASAVQVYTACIDNRASATYFELDKSSIPPAIVKTYGAQDDVGSGRGMLSNNVVTFLLAYALEQSVKRFLLEQLSAS